MDIFISKGGSCSCDDERIWYIEVPLKYKYPVKQWVPKELPPLDIDFSVNNRMYHIARSSLHGLGIFSMDGITIKYNKVTKLMDNVRPCYDYNDWMQLVRYRKGMRRYALAASYIQLININKNKEMTIYIEQRPKASCNIVGFINDKWLKTSNKQPNCIYEGCEGNWVVMCTIKKIDPREELLVDYHLNQIDTSTNSVWVLMQPRFSKPLLIALYLFYL